MKNTLKKGVILCLHSLQCLHQSITMQNLEFGIFYICFEEFV